MTASRRDFIVGTGAAIARSVVLILIRLGTEQLLRIERKPGIDTVAHEHRRRKMDSDNRRSFMDVSGGIGDAEESGAGEEAVEAS